MTNFAGMTHAIFKLLLWQMLMQSTIFPEGFLSFIKGMLELENYHFVIAKEIVDSGKDCYQ